MRHLLILLTFMAAMIMNAYMAYAAENATSQVLLGPETPFNQGVCQSWVTLDAAGNPEAIGLNISAAALAGLPEERLELDVTLPDQAPAPYTHIGLNWNPQGHIPPGIYDVPHFDIHFYLISQAERDAITLKDGTLELAYQQLATQDTPPGYIIAPESAEPRMGSHLVDLAWPEFQGQPFSASFIFGSYQGQVCFIEPMIAKSFLDAKSTTTKAIPQPQRYSHAGFYPQQYSVSYDATTDTYMIALEQLKQFTP